MQVQTRARSSSMEGRTLGTHTDNMKRRLPHRHCPLRLGAVMRVHRHRTQGSLTARAYLTIRQLLPPRSTISRPPIRPPPTRTNTPERHTRLPDRSTSISTVIFPLCPVTHLTRSSRWTADDGPPCLTRPLGRVSRGSWGGSRWMRMTGTPTCDDRAMGGVWTGRSRKRSHRVARRRWRTRWEMGRHWRSRRGALLCAMPRPTTAKEKRSSLRLRARRE